MSTADAAGDADFDPAGGGSIPPAGGDPFPAGGDAELPEYPAHHDAGFEGPRSPPTSPSRRPRS